MSNKMPMGLRWPEQLIILLGLMTTTLYLVRGQLGGGLQLTLVLGLNLLWLLFMAREYRAAEHQKTTKSE
jgi:hypothetical protein